VSLTAAAPMAAGAARPILRMGSQGAAVRDLQKLLKVGVDGKFGPKTREAVLKLQRSRNLVVDGVVGPRTWQALDASTTPAPTPVSTPASARPTLRLGSTGPAVAEAQRLLTRAGYRTTADGKFGSGTQRSVINLQKGRGLAADGVIGPATWATLGTPVAVPVTLISSSGPPPSPWHIYGARPYTVKSGDTLTSIAAANASTAASLATANRLAPGSRPSPGTRIYVPGPWRCPAPGTGFINDYGFARAGHLHQGNDLFGPRGTPVIAPVRGRVERRQGGLGGLAVNLYGEDGHRYYFAHLDRYGAGGSVAAGAVIGYIGNTGNAITTLPHLHFEIHPNNGGPVNPFPTITLACKR
jgi:peptidoglycan hydrolase-like protein with peptidoglycan-binding domain